MHTHVHTHTELGVRKSGRETIRATMQSTTSTLVKHFMTNGNGESTAAEPSTMLLTDGRFSSSTAVFLLIKSHSVV